MNRILVSLCLVLLLSHCSNKDIGNAARSKTAPKEKPFTQSVEIVSLSGSTNELGMNSLKNLFDGDEKSLWIVGGDNAELGQYISLRFSKEVLFNKIVVCQAMDKSVSRIRELIIAYENEESQSKRTVILNDKDSPDIIPLDTVIRAKTITIYVRSAYLRRDNEKRSVGLADLSFYYDNEQIKIDNIKSLDRLRIKPEKHIHTAELQQVRPYNVYASSVKDGIKAYNYGAENLTDDNPKTVWVEGQPHEGIKEFLQFDLSVKELNLAGFSVQNGNQTTDKSFKEFNRVKNIDIELSLITEKGTKAIYRKEIVLDDKANWQYHPLVFSVKAQNSRGIVITVMINSVYFGQNVNETALSGIKFYSKGLQ